MGSAPAAGAAATLPPSSRALPDPLTAALLAGNRHCLHPCTQLRPLAKGVRAVIVEENGVHVQEHDLVTARDPSGDW